MRLILSLSLCCACLTAPVWAETVNSKQARALVYSPKKVEVELIERDFLSETDRAILNQVAGQQPYYAAIAASPSEGLMSQSLLAATQFHDVENAQAKALEGCDAARDAASEPCVIVAMVRPKGWEPRALQLSVEATTTLRKEYRKLKAPKALAIAPSTGKWVIADGDGAAEAALAECIAKTGATDCSVAVAD